MVGDHNVGWRKRRKLNLSVSGRSDDLRKGEMGRSCPSLFTGTGCRHPGLLEASTLWTHSTSKALKTLNLEALQP